MAQGKLRFSYSPAQQKAAIPAVSQVYDYASQLAGLFDNLLKEGRYKSLAMTHLEQAALWAQRELETPK